ncbi:MAG: regulatory iron-sulfur-containing complex subunit RicT [Candidatus Hydrogenedentes bacterium]|nr:regulatory iron-sulfur-containing complex subunit RicT [Candidatus Hydrogenedentota bacterium]
MAQTVKVRLRKPTQVFDFLVKDIPLAPGDGCIVRSDRGLEYGFCTMPPEECPPEEEKNYPMTIVRKATHNDETTFRQILADEERAKALCMGKIEQRNLPMRLVDVEYTFDRHKIVFYFTADERVDFRELVRDLAHELKTRIELRHIQVRDKAKIVGGIASCGRELCCATWMGEFMPISMKMAKRQNLSLNPSKISGQCGRLMCCLSYENHNYSDKKKKKAAPAVEPAGEAAELDDVAPDTFERQGARHATCRACPAGSPQEDVLPEDEFAEDAGEWDDSVAVAEEGENEALLAEEDGAEDIEERTECGQTVYVIDPESGEEISSEQPGQPAEPRPRRKSRRRRKRRHPNRAGGTNPPA